MGKDTTEGCWSHFLYSRSVLCPLPSCSLYPFLPSMSSLSIPVSQSDCIFLNIFFKRFFYLRETERVRTLMRPHRRKGRGIESSSRVPTLHRAPHGAQSCDAGDHASSQTKNQTLNQRSHPHAPAKWLYHFTFFLAMYEF